MPTTFAALNSAQPDDYFSCAQRWATLVDDFDRYTADYQQSVITPVDSGTWTGTAATAAKQSVNNSSVQISVTRTYVDGVRALLNATGEGVGQAKSRLLAAVRIAAGAGIPVDGDGRIIPDVAITEPGVDWNNPPILAGMTAQNMIYQALHMADTMNAIVDPQLGYASKLSPTDTGPWLTDATTDHDNALATARTVRDTLNSIAVDEQPYHDELPQPYNTEQGNPGDWARYQFLREVVVPGLLVTGRPHAAMAFQNFLDNSGDPLPINPEHVIKDVPVFRQTVLDALLTQGSCVVDTGWTSTNVEDPSTGIAQNEDW